MRRFVKDVQGPYGQSARIFLDDDEYQVVFFKGGSHLEDADYFTRDLEDAEGTASMQLRERWP